MTVPKHRIRVHALTPLLFRDGRPFGSSADESRARGSVIPMPSVVAGLIRTAHGNQQGWNWKDPQWQTQAKNICVGFHGLVMARGDNQPELLLPAPADAVVFAAADGSPTVTAARPLRLRDGEGSDLPEDLALLEVASTGKPIGGYELWAWPDMLAWLKGQGADGVRAVPDKQPLPPVDERVHVAMGQRGHSDLRGPRTVADGMLFTVEYQAWERTQGVDHQEWSLLVAADESPSGMAHFGGEARPVQISSQGPELPQPDKALLTALSSSTKLRCVLATPAIFSQGWRPTWLLRSTALAEAGASLAAAAVGSPGVVSGWNYALRCPKRARRLAPAGSVYFLDLARPLTATEVTELWLATVSDNEQDRKDGFGSAMWGVW